MAVSPPSALQGVVTDSSGAPVPATNYPDSTGWQKANNEHRQQGELYLQRYCSRRLHREASAPQLVLTEPVKFTWEIPGPGPLICSSVLPLSSRA